MNASYGLILILLCLSSGLSWGQQKGAPLLQNYDRKTYAGNPRNWSVAVGTDGLVYFGNTYNLLVYDGESWQKHLPDEIITAMLPTAERIYAAAYDDFGYITQNGQDYSFTSLTDQLPDSLRNSVFVANVVKQGDWVYFGGEDALYLFNESSKKLTFKSNPYGYSQVYQHPDGTCFILDQESMRLARLEKDSLLFIDEPAPELQNIEQNLRGVAPGKGSDLLLFFDNSIYRFDTRRKTYERLRTEVDTQLQNDAIYETEYISDQNGDFFYVLGTHRHGILVIDAAGKLITQVNQDNGLIHNDVTDLAFHDGLLWVATNKGISKVALGYPFGYFGERQGLESAVLSVHRSRKGMLYVGTNTGLSYQIQNRFQPVRNMPTTQCWQIEDFEGGGVIVAGGNSGFFHVRDGESLQKITQDWATMAIERSRQDSTIVFQACYQGFYILRYQNGTFRELGEVPTMDTVVSRSVVEDEKGNIWVGGRGTGFHRIRWDGKDVSTAQMSVHIKGLKDVSWCKVWRGEEDIFFSDNVATYTYEAATDSFIPYRKPWMQQLPAQFANNPGSWEQDTQGKRWHGSSRTLFRPTEDGYEADTLSLRPIEVSIYAFYEDRDSTYWLGTDDGLFHYDPSWKFTLPKGFKTAIRRVSLLRTDSVLSPASEPPQLDYQHNGLRFEVAVLSFFDEATNKYQYRLSGSDRQAVWSDWTSEPFKEYTNLWEGDYVLAVRGKNRLGQQSPVTEFTFSVQPPPYRTGWAYAMYSVLGVLLVFGIVRLNSQRLRNANERLEATVAERTSEIKQQNEEILVQTERLRQVNEELNTTLEISESRKQELERQHRNISDSIAYAQRIQAAMLPFERRIQESVSDFFVLFKPRDRVSGDFYWFYDTSQPSQYGLRAENAPQPAKRHIVMAAADCTGHGVPGAFMSMIGNELLTQIVEVSQVYQPDEILRRLDAGIRYALQQRESGNRDGMDISICTYVPEEQKIYFAGAGNPLYYVQDDTFKVIKGDRRGLGGHVAAEKLPPFTAHTITVAAPTTCYLSSDGYRDQFGGKKGRKLMSKGFQRLVREGKHLPMDAQKQRLADFLDEWRGHYRQIDDILVFAARFG